MNLFGAIKVQFNDLMDNEFFSTKKLINQLGCENLNYLITEIVGLSLKQGRKRPLDTTKKMIKRRELEREKGIEGEI